MTAPLAITMGDPAGVGPQIVAAGWDALGLKAQDTILVGAVAAFRDTIIGDRLVSINQPQDLPNGLAETLAGLKQDAVPILPVDLDTCTPGEPDKHGAVATARALEKAVDLALGGQVSGLVTAPIHKANLYAAGFSFPGHTEYLADRAGLGPDDVVMMLTSERQAPPMRVVPLTVHIPLKDVPRALTTDVIVRKTIIIHDDLKARYGIKKPRLALAGLNPHAGEDGTIGMEEATHLRPALWMLEDQGIKVTGPLSADTLFHAESRGHYDAIICCYHDQALIPLKTVDFWGGVNATLGLPFIRTSPDHGSAYDQAKTGTARADSMIEAIKLARHLGAHNVGS